MDSSFIRALPACSAAALLLTLSACMSGLYSGGNRSGNISGAADAAPPTQLITGQLIKDEQQEREQRSRQDIGPLVIANPAPYTIDPGDILSIVVWDHPELAGAAMSAIPGVNDPAQQGVPPSGFVVDHEGRVQFPFAGMLKLAGLTEEQARNLLASKLARYIASPSVTLRVHA